MIEKVLKGHLRITAKEGAGKSIIGVRDLVYELDGVNIGSKLKELKLEFTNDAVIIAHAQIYLSDLLVDIPSAQLLAQLIEDSDLQSTLEATD